MKTILFSLLFFAFTALNAQFVITATANPAAGDVEATVDLNTTGLTVPVSGTNKLWNYTNLIYNYNSVSSQTYVPIASVPNHTLFPNATIAAYDGYGNYEVYKMTNSSRDELGSAAATASDCTVFSDPITLFSLPFSYGNSYYDTYSINSPGDVVSGSITACGCGTGTLTLPGYTVNNVLLVTLSFQFTENYNSTVYSSTGVIYEFYSSLSKFPLLTINTETDTQSSSTQIYGSVNKNFALGVGIKESLIDAKFGVYPNPVNHETVFINFTNTKSEDITVKLYNTLGQLIKEENYNNLPAGENKVQLNLKNIPPGIYSLQIKTGGTESVKKLIID